MAYVPSEASIQRARERIKENQRQRRAKARKLKLCYDCLAPRDTPLAHCSRCYEKLLARRDPIVERIKWAVRRERARAESLCYACMKPRDNETTRCNDCRAIAKEKGYSARSSKKYRERKKQERRNEP